MKHVICKPHIRIDWTKAEANGISKEEISRHLPKYLIDPDPLECGIVRYWWLKLLGLFFITMTRLVLRPRKGQVGNLDLQEVDCVYDKEARHYDWKHHMTTRGQDKIWRRQAGWFLVNLAKTASERLRVLDLCTGTGLTIEEASIVFREFVLPVDFVGLDYNRKMLQVAKSRRNGEKHSADVNVKFVRGNAMKLTGGTDPDCISFPLKSFDAVTQVFGIGGINDSLAVFEGVLQVLKSGGQYLVIDMHQPIASQPREMPFFWKWQSFPAFERLAYNQHIMPIVLNRLWGWKDSTLDFYSLPLTTWQEQIGTWWGFETVSFEVENQRWWLGLPFMPIARIAVKKVEIGQAEAEKRQKILALLSDS